MLYTILLFTFISITSFLSRRISLTVLVFLLPFYTILREFSGIGLFSFLWPYFWLSILILLEIHNNRDIKSTKLKYIDTLNLVLLSVCIALTFSKGISGFSIVNIGSIFTNTEYIFLTSVCLIYFLTFINKVFIKIKSLENSISYLDWSILFFILYGFLQVFLSLFDDRDFFNSVLGFRYYFSGAIIYFLARTIFISKKDLIAAFLALLMSILFASIFIYLESVLLNVMNIDPKTLAWNRGVLGSFFDYGPDLRTFIDIKLVPMGVMYMLHLSGVFNLLGFVILFPFIYYLDEFENRRYKAFVLLFVILSPLSFIFASKTTIVLFYVSIFTTALFLIKFWKKSILIVPLFAILIPFTYSYHLLPGMTQDYGRVISYLISPQTGTKEKLVDFSGPGANQIKSGKSIFFKNKRDERVLNNSILDLIESAKADITENSDLLSRSKLNENTKVTIDSEGLKIYEGGKIVLDLSDVNKSKKVSTDSIVNILKVLEDRVLSIDNSNLEILDHEDLTIDNSFLEVLNDEGLILTIDNSYLETIKDINMSKYVENHATKNKSSSYIFLLGGGYQISEWSKITSNSTLGLKDYKLNTRSDTPYLNYFFQFGVLGMIFLFLVIMFSLIYPLMSFKNNSNNILKVISIGIFTAMLVQCIGLLHLQILFKTGLNTSLFVLMALSLRVYAWRDQNKHNV